MRRASSRWAQGAQGPDAQRAPAAKHAPAPSSANASRRPDRLIARQRCLREEDANLLRRMRNAWAGHGGSGQTLQRRGSSQHPVCRQMEEQDVDGERYYEPQARLHDVLRWRRSSEDVVDVDRVARCRSGWGPPGPQISRSAVARMGCKARRQRSQAAPRARRAGAASRGMVDSPRTNNGIFGSNM